VLSLELFELNLSLAIGGGKQFDKLSLLYSQAKSTST
jgi:hypothetical protein